MIRFRRGKFAGLGIAPGTSSLISAPPPDAILSNSSRFSGG